MSKDYFWTWIEAWIRPQSMPIQIWVCNHETRDTSYGWAHTTLSLAGQMLQTEGGKRAERLYSIFVYRVQIIVCSLCLMYHLVLISTFELQMLEWRAQTSELVLVCTETTQQIDCFCVSINKFIFLYDSAILYYLGTFFVM
jgi:hypothetical protein